MLTIEKLWYRKCVVLEDVSYYVVISGMSKFFEKSVLSIFQDQVLIMFYDQDCYRITVEGIRYIKYEFMNDLE